MSDGVASRIGSRKRWGVVRHTVWCGMLLMKFKNDANMHGHIWYRVFNEVPVIFLVLIVILVVYKPI